MTKCSNGRNRTVGRVRFDSQVEYYGNKAVNKIRRDCMGANKLSRSFAKAHEKRKRKTTYSLSRSYIYICYTGTAFNDLLLIFALSHKYV